MTRYNFVGRGYSDDWNKETYGENGYSAHVPCPVIVDTDEKKKAIMAFSENYVTKHTERIVGHVRAPVVVTQYQYTSQVEVEPLEEYGGNKWPRLLTPVYDYSEYGSEYGSSSPTKVGIDKWCTPSSLVHDRPQVEVTNRYGSPTKVEPPKNSRVTDDDWGRTSNPVRDPLPKVNDFPTKIKAEYTQPTRPGPFRVTNWHNPPNSIGQGRSSDNREDARNNNNSDRNKPNANTMQDESFMEPYITNNDRWEDHGRKGLTTPPPQPNSPLPGATTEVSRPTRPGLLRATYWRNPINSVEEGRTTDSREDPNNNDWNKPYGNTIQDESVTEPYVTNKNGWQMPGRKGWTMSLPPPNAQLSGRTNDIGKAVEILTEGVKPSYIAPAPPQFTVPKRDSYAPYVETIDSKEAARRYGKLNPSTRPPQTEDNYTRIIDSKEAARKYKGVEL